MPTDLEIDCDVLIESASAFANKVLALQQENAALRRKLKVLCEPPMTIEQAEAEIRAIGELPAAKDEDVDKWMTEVRRLAALPKCEKCGRMIES